MTYVPHTPSGPAMPPPGIDFGGPDRTSIEIGLINNMPDAALRATERQIRSLLERAADGTPVRLKIYTIPEIPRSPMGRELASGYLDISELWNARLDGIIVTGNEPRTENLRDEPYWDTLTRVMNWAERNTTSAVWSCLAAHAALLHLDGVDRVRLPEKRFGIFDCTRVVDHPLTAGLPERIRMPHSRWNELPEDALTAAGYRLLTRSPEAGADAFVKEGQSLFVFFQGHPEYEADTLLLEYRRDIGRYLRRERETYPNMPLGYFDGELLDAVNDLHARAIADRREDLLATFPLAQATSTVANTWRSAATGLYRNWLGYLAARQQKVLTAG